VKGVENGDEQFGGSLAAGDFNGDGFADLAAGDPSETVQSWSSAGAVNVLYGASGGLQADSPDDQLWAQGIDSLKDAAEPGDYFSGSI
jgi:hypothetical protein